MYMHLKVVLPYGMNRFSSEGAGELLGPSPQAEMLPEDKEFSDEQAESVYFPNNKTATCEFSNFEKMRKSSHNYRLDMLVFCWFP